MYTGDHKTAKLSQTLITDALLTLLETVPFTDISVSRLCQQAQVSRQTFYSLFGTKENVLLHALETSCCFEPAAQAGGRHHWGGQGGAQQLHDHVAAHAFYAQAGASHHG